MLSVMKGDGSYQWTGAAGIAHGKGQIPIARETPFYIASITKLYTATAIMKLFEDKRISLDDPMSKYLPDELIKGIHKYKGKDYSKEINIRQLLSHKSGIADYYSEEAKNGKSLFDIFVEDPERLWTVDETINRARNDLEPNFEPGTDASYSDTNFQLLGKIIETVTGKQLHDVYEDFFFRPLGLKHTWLVGHANSQFSRTVAPADIVYNDMIITKTRSNGSYWADGGIVSTAEDGIQFLKALNEGRIVSKATLEIMHQWNKIEFPLQYGFGTMYFKLPPVISAIIKVPPVWGHSGSTGSFLYHSKALNLYLSGTINQVDANSTAFRLMIKAMLAFRSKIQGQQTRED